MPSQKVPVKLFCIQFGRRDILNNLILTQWWQFRILELNNSAPQYPFCPDASKQVLAQPNKRFVSIV